MSKIKMIDVYKEMPADKQEATERAKLLADFLQQETGVQWKIRVHENLGWFYSAQYGTISISQYAQSYGNGGYLLLNGANYGCGTGHAQLESFNPKTSKELLKCISYTISDYKIHVENHIQAYNKNKKLKQFLNLTYDHS